MVQNFYDPSHEDAVAAAKDAALEKDATAEAAARGLEAAMKAGKVSFDAAPEANVRVFVAPVERNTRYLTNPSERKITQINDPNSPTGKRDMSTTGDIWVEFREGIVIIDLHDPNAAVQVAWAEAHPEICRDISEPMAAAWVQMKEAQTPTARREASLPTGLDVDRLLRGDTSAMRSGNKTADRARQALDNANAGG